MQKLLIFLLMGIFWSSFLYAATGQDSTSRHESGGGVKSSAEQYKKLLEVYEDPEGESLMSDKISYHIAWGVLLGLFVGIIFGLFLILGGVLFGAKLGGGVLLKSAGAGVVVGGLWGLVEGGAHKINRRKLKEN